MNLRISWHPRKPISSFGWLTLSALFSLFIAHGSALGAASFPELQQRFQGEIAAAKQTVENPDRISGRDRFLLMFSRKAKSIDEQIGRDLLVLGSQQEVINAYLKKQPKGELRSLKAPPNQRIYNYGLQAVKTLMKLNCQTCQTAEERATYRKASEDLIKIFDLHDIHDSFSGLPFYGLVKQRFAEAKFQDEVNDFTQRLSGIVKSFESNPTHQLSQNVYDIALQSCDGDHKAAVEMLGILTSRDVLITRYLKYFSSSNQSFIESFAQAPVLVRLVAELDQRARGSDLDLFSVASLDDALSTRRNYYYWSSALAAEKLKEAGYPATIVAEVVESFPKQYKTLRYLEQFGFLNSPERKQYYKRDTITVGAIARSGAKIGINAAEQIDTSGASSGEPERLEGFLKTLVEPPSVERENKVSILRAIARREPTTSRHAYLLYYDVKSDLIGYPHLKLVMGGKAYEIHRKPRQNGSYLRERDLTNSLKDARSGYLPSGILELPITGEQMVVAKQFLEAESDASMRYSFFNRLIHSDNYNCGGILYDALQKAGVGDLPPLPRIKAFPGQMLRFAYQHANDARFVGRGESWMHELVRPNWSLKSIPRPLKPNPATPGQTMFAPKLGSEFINAEQLLVDRIPDGADPINLLGKILPTYSNNGALPASFTPSRSQVLPLTTLLIPEEDYAMIVTSKKPSIVRETTLAYRKGDKKLIRFFIHPNELEHYKDLIAKYPKDETQWIATPSSSARSLFVTDSTAMHPPFIVKSSLSVPMGGSQRLIDDERVARAVAVNDLMEEIHSQNGGRLSSSGKTWDFFRESYAVLSPKPELGGYIFREVPEALKNDIVLPFYSLIADRSPKPKWIDELFKSSKHASMNEFVWEDIVKPLLDMHATLMENGITSELHQQNICLTVDRKTGSIKGLLLKDMDGNWIDHSLRTHRLGKPSIHFSSFENDAYLFRYAMAPENHYDSYVDMLRERNIRNTFKFVLNPNELSELISASDKYLIGRFNRAFPEHKIDNISQYKNAWKKLSDASITPEERLVYERIRSTRKEVGVGAFLRRFYNRKLEASLTYPTGSLRDTTLCIIQALKANWK